MMRMCASLSSDSDSDSSHSSDSLASLRDLVVDVDAMSDRSAERAVGGGFLLEEEEEYVWSDER
jgi:hypothetical protein